MTCPKCNEEAMEAESLDQYDSRGYGQPGYHFVCESCGYEWNGDAEDLDEAKE